MVRVAIIEQHGGPEAIQWQDADIAAPGPGEVQLKNTAVGLNFIDTYHRRGIYPTDLPTGLGIEAAAIVEAVGEGVRDFAPGDRVATYGMPLGAYATHRNVPADMMLCKLPDDIDHQTAAAAMVKGCTAEFLIERCAKVEKDWPVLVHAAAGGTGLILVQWLKHIGAYVIGTVSTEEKADKAKAAGADDIIFYQQEDTAQRVRQITDGAGVRVVFDGVGLATWEASLDSCGRRGLIINFGNADSPVGGVDLGILALKGSLYNTRPTLWDYYTEPEDRDRGTAKLFDMIRKGIISINIGQRYALEEAAQAHKDLQNRKTVGSTILLP
ncbi:quinone oxidoreductase family protein [Alterisphingorhabdus coralli]|uniref:Quinone oxidoreductase n=1 Tax=Alterisphingorhabdus coralli TaxID=3071408 RepID=A0AA97I1K5_9SPHN|nr:quinone oxidoreductase [Parasphingorhabdus sp. SCSIO 66989]WOE75390.1 quinone oxidoreductase [Parasphingorhabdus sp. SCSIO 66989]